MNGLTVVRLWGLSPVQAVGFVWGFPFYFRARGDSWRFAVALSREPARDEAILVAAGEQTGFLICRRYGRPGAGEASFMPDTVAITIIETWARVFIETLFVKRAG